MIDKAGLGKMELHAVESINENLFVMRVASGWIYLHYKVFFAVENNIRTKKAELTHTTFVPESAGS